MQFPLIFEQSIIVYDQNPKNKIFDVFKRYPDLRK